MPLEVCVINPNPLPCASRPCTRTRSWQFSSLHIDEDYTAPLRVNNQGDFSCINETACVHPVDYEHYTRKNNLWGKGSDTTEGWMDGKEGFCAFC
jgi:hypothetical protein